MKITIVDNLESICWKNVCAVFDSVGWKGRNAEVIESAFKRSSFCRIAYDGDAIIGFGRTVDDGRYYAWIVDLVVSPDYQGKGIGKKMLSHLVKDLAAFKTISLVSADGKEGFYKKQGWVVQKSISFIAPKVDVK